jgi:PD-(D/E)XK nuclease superfamily protein
MTAQLQLGLKPDDSAKQTPDDLVLWSVTTIIGVLEKPALLYWTAEEAAKAAVASHRSLGQRIEEEGEEAVVKWLRDARFRRPADRLSNSDLGTVCHTACEEYALTGSRPDASRLEFLVHQSAGAKFTGTKAEVAVLVKMLDQFDGWLQRFTPSYQATEVAVYSPQFGYAGTTDAFLTIDGVRFIGDYKSSRDPFDSKGQPKTPYPEQVGLQLAAYRYAELAAVWRPRRTEKFRRRYYLLGPSEQAVAQPVPEVDTGLVIHITPEACESYPIRCDEEIHRAFLFALEVFRWVNQTSKEVMGFPLEGPTKWEMG